MIYRVSWDTDAFSTLERIWDEQDDPAEIVRAFDVIHGILSENAEQQGESRSRGRRILIAKPLGVVFQAQPRLAEVLILRVWMIRKRTT